MIREFANDFGIDQLQAILQQGGIPSTTPDGACLPDNQLRARVRRLTLTLDRQQQETLVALALALQRLSTGWG